MDDIGTGTFGRVKLVKYIGNPSTTGADGKQKTNKNASTTQYYAMKSLRKADIIKLKQTNHILSEASILSSISHHFIVNLFSAFQDRNTLYMILEYVPGGELFSLLRKENYLSVDAARFYSCEIFLALEYLHSLDIAYRDLKPENLLLTKTGHIKFTDFGFAKVVPDRTWTLCGTPEYIAPEVLQSKGHGMPVDWWAYGVLVYEMLAGFPPFFDETPFGIYTKILAGEFQYPKHVDINARPLISGLLTSDLTRRLGCLHSGSDDIKKATWFSKVNWKNANDRLVTVS